MVRRRRLVEWSHGVDGSCAQIPAAPLQRDGRAGPRGARAQQRADQRRLHHAYLFTGTRGIGKTTVSRILAKSLNCTGPDGQGGVTAEPCGQCQACTEIDADRYIDYIELDAASNRGIDEVRDLIERAAYKPSVGRFKVFMIDEAHQLTKDAFNALLKTLEEPPEYLKFVLATTDPEKMLPTVLSRCLQFNLRPMAPPDGAGASGARAGGRERAARRRLVAPAVARGARLDARCVVVDRPGHRLRRGRLDEAAVRAMLGSVERSVAAAFVQALAARDGAALLAAVDDVRQRGLSAAGALEEMAALLQQMAIAQAVPGALDDEDPDTPEALRLSGLLAPDEVQLLYSVAVHGREELPLLSDEYAALTMVLLRFLAFPAAPPGALATRAVADSAAHAEATVVAAAQNSRRDGVRRAATLARIGARCRGHIAADKPRHACRASCRRGAHRTAAHRARRTLGDIGEHDVSTRPGQRAGA